MRRVQTIIRTYRSLIVSVGVVLVAFAGIFGGVIPAASSTLALVSELRASAERMSLLESKATTLQNLNSETLNEKLAILVSAVPTDKSIPTIFATIDRLSAEAGIVVSDLEIQSPGSLATEAATRQTAEEKQIGSLITPFSLSIEGTLNQTIAFIRSLTSVRRLLRVRNFDVNFISSGLVVTRLGVDAFYVPLPETLPSVGQPLAAGTSEEEAVLAKLSAYRWVSTPAQKGVQTPPAAPGKTNPFAK